MGFEEFDKVTFELWADGHEQDVYTTYDETEVHLEMLLGPAPNIRAVRSSTWYSFCRVLHLIFGLSGLATDGFIPLWMCVFVLQ